MACNQGNNTLNPYQSIIDGINKGVTTLEKQADIIQPVIDEFDDAVDAITTPTLPSALNVALNNLTAEAICASSTDLEPLNDLSADCLLEASAAIKRYTKNIRSNLEEGTKLIVDIITLPEGGLFTLFQKIRGLATDIKDLVTALNNKIQCVSLSDSAVDYQSQIDDINDRINTVIDDLRLSDDGSFDVDIFLSDLGEDLQDNIKAYNTKAEGVKEEIEQSISNTVSSTTVNPRSYF